MNYINNYKKSVTFSFVYWYLLFAVNIVCNNEMDV